jgi:hypothetical protein
MPSEALQFVHNIDKHQRLQYIPNRDRVRPGSENGQQIVNVQADKTYNKRASNLPILRVRRTFTIQFLLCGRNLYRYHLLIYERLIGIFL